MAWSRGNNTHGAVKKKCSQSVAREKDTIDNHPFNPSWDENSYAAAVHMRCHHDHHHRVRHVEVGACGFGEPFFLSAVRSGPVCARRRGVQERGGRLSGDDTTTRRADVPVNKNAQDSPRPNNPYRGKRRYSPTARVWTSVPF